MELEDRGIPTVAVHTTVFTNSAEAHALAFGRPDYISAYIRHPIASINPAEVIERAEEVGARVANLFLGEDLASQRKTITQDPVEKAPPKPKFVLVKPPKLEKLVEKPDSANPAPVLEALEMLRGGLQADGADLQLVGVQGGEVRVALVVTPETCLECIVPGPVLHKVIETSLRRAWPEMRSLQLEDPRA